MKSFTIINAACLLLLVGCVVPPRPEPPTPPDPISDVDAVLVQVLADYADGCAEAYEQSASESSQESHLRAFQAASKEARKAAHMPETEAWAKLEWQDDSGRELADKYAPKYRKLAEKIRGLK